MFLIKAIRMWVLTGYKDGYDYTNDIFEIKFILFQIAF